VCAFYVRVRVRPALRLRFFVSSRNAAPRGSRLLPARSRAFFIWARVGPRKRNAVVPGGTRDDTSPMSPRRLGMFAACHASPSSCAIYCACAPINGESHCQIVIWTVLLQAEKMTRSFSLVSIGLGGRKCLAVGRSRLVIFSYLDYRFDILFIVRINLRCPWNNEKERERRKREHLCFHNAVETTFRSFRV